VGATAECGDGLYSHSVTRSGTCSHHDGVAEWCPCGSPSNSTLAGANAPQADADQHFLSLLSQIPGVTVVDPAAITASGRQICIYLQNGSWACTRARWVGGVNLDRRARGGEGPLSESERDELNRLRKENAELAMERDVLKRSAALWVKEAMRR